jgi:hypothetical protein
VSVTATFAARRQLGAAEANAVYWINGSENSLVKMRKP